MSPSESWLVPVGGGCLHHVGSLPGSLLNAISELIGHTSTRMTEPYLTIEDEYKRKAIQSLDGLFAR